MQNPADNPSRPPFFKRLFSWRTLGRCLIGLAILATLLAGLYTEENWRGKRAWENYKRQAEAGGVEFDWQKVIPRVVPDDQNFAMTPLLAPLYELNPVPLKPGQSIWRDKAGAEKVMNLAKKLPDDPHSVTPTEMLADLQPYQLAMRELIAASHRPYVRYNIDYGYPNSGAILLPHLAVLKKLARLFEYRATAELALNENDAAISDIDMGFYLADTLDHDPFLLSLLVHNAMLSLISVPIRDGIAKHSWSDKQLQQLEGLLEPVNELENFSTAVRGERAIFGIGSFDWMRAHPDKNDAFNAMPSGWVYLEQLAYHRAIDAKLLPSFNPSGHRVFPALADQIPISFPKTFAGRAKMFFHHEILAQGVIGSFSESLARVAYDQSKLDELLAVCALERYRLTNGHLPEALDTLVPKFIDQLPHDICTGEPLKYHRIADDQFTLYSVGWNLIDDGGKLAKDSEGRPKLNEGDWPWVPSDVK